MADKANRASKEAADADTGSETASDKGAAKEGKAARGELTSRKAIEAARALRAARFKALGDTTRLHVVELLRDQFLESPSLSSSSNIDVDSEEEGAESDVSDANGMTVGTLSIALGGKAKGSSTLSHHLKELRQAGLISMRRRGKNLVCRIEPEALADLRCDLEMRSPLLTALPATIAATVVKEETNTGEKGLVKGRTRITRPGPPGKTVRRGKNDLTAAAAVIA